MAQSPTMLLFVGVTDQTNGSTSARWGKCLEGCEATDSVGTAPSKPAMLIDIFFGGILWIYSQLFRSFFLDTQLFSFIYLVV